jgi:hypothetical protein
MTAEDIVKLIKMECRAANNTLAEAGEDWYEYDHGYRDALAKLVERLEREGF